MDKKLNNFSRRLFLHMMKAMKAFVLLTFMVASLSALAHESERLGSDQPDNHNDRSCALCLLSDRKDQSEGEFDDGLDSGIDDENDDRQKTAHSKNVDVTDYSGLFFNSLQLENSPDLWRVNEKLLFFVHSSRKSHQFDLSGVSLRAPPLSL